MLWRKSPAGTQQASLVLHALCESNEHDHTGLRGCLTFTAEVHAMAWHVHHIRSCMESQAKQTGELLLC